MVVVVVAVVVVVIFHKRWTYMVQVIIKMQRIHEYNTLDI